MGDIVEADGHFVAIPEWVLYGDISCHAVRLYGVLRRYADMSPTGQAFPSRATLSERCHTSVATVNRALRELLDFGAITREVNAHVPGRGQTPSTYRLVMVRS